MTLSEFAMVYMFFVFVTTAALMLWCIKSGRALDKYEIRICFFAAFLWPLFALGLAEALVFAVLAAVLDGIAGVVEYMYTNLR